MPAPKGKCNHVIGFKEIIYEGGFLVYPGSEDDRDSIDKEDDFIFKYCPKCGEQIINGGE